MLYLLLQTENPHHSPPAITGPLTGHYVYGKSNPSVPKAFYSWICQLENYFELTLESKHNHLYGDCSEFTKQIVLLSVLIPYLHYISYFGGNFYRSSYSLRGLLEVREHASCITVARAVHCLWHVLSDQQIVVAYINGQLRQSKVQHTQNSTKSFMVLETLKGI